MASSFGHGRRPQGQRVEAQLVSNRRGQSLVVQARPDVLGPRPPTAGSPWFDPRTSVDSSRTPEAPFGAAPGSSPAVGRPRARPASPRPTALTHLRLPALAGEGQAAVAVHAHVDVGGECAEGRGVRADDKHRGVWLDTPRLERSEPGVLEKQFPNLMSRTRIAGLDPRTQPLLVHPTLHYQNGGIAIGVNGETSVPGLFAVGEVSGGIHGRNRIMGNALLEIISFGRRAGAAAFSKANRDRGPKKVTLEHVNRHRRALTIAGLPMDRRAPQVLPPYAAAGVWRRREPS